MATNVFFDHDVKSEQMLYEDLVIEALGIYGQEVYYIPRSVIRKDEILNEDYSKYEAAYNIEMYIADTQGFEGDGSFLSKFGLEIRDQATFVVSRNRFSQLIEIDSNEIYEERPREGDLIYLPLSNTMFEIQFVEHEKPFYQLKNLPVYELQCEVFEYNSEIFDTENPDIDAFEEHFADVYIVEIQGGNRGFYPGEKIKQHIGNDVFILGEVSKFVEFEIPTSEPRKGNLYLTQTKASDGSLTRWQEGITIESIDTPSNSGWIILKELDNSDEFGNDEIAQNTVFEIDSEDIVDWSTDNPFGDPRI